MNKLYNFMQTNITDHMHRISGLESERDKQYSKLCDMAIQINRLECERLDFIRAMDNVKEEFSKTLNEKEERIKALEQAIAEQAKVNEAILSLKEKIDELANAKRNNGSDDVEKSMQSTIKSMLEACGLGVE